MELVRRCDRCMINGFWHHGKVCVPGCTAGTADVQQRHQDGPLRGQLIPDDVWTLEQLTELGQARAYARRVHDESAEADIAVDLRTGRITLD